MSIKKIIVFIIFVVIGGLWVEAIKKRIERKPTKSRMERNRRRKNMFNVCLYDGTLASVQISNQSALSPQELREDNMIRRSVKYATAAKINKGLPIAKYDLARKQTYWQHSDGRREYVK